MSSDGEEEKEKPMKMPPEESGANKGVELTLYVAGKEPNSERARENLRTIREKAGTPAIRVIDVYREFEAALRERIVVTPALVVTTAHPPRRMVFLGTLEDTDAVRAWLDAEKVNHE